MANVWGQLLATLGKSLGTGLTETQRFELQQKEQQRTLLQQADAQSRLATAQWMRELLGKAPEQPGYEMLNDEDRAKLQQSLSSIVTGNLNDAVLQNGLDVLSKVASKSQQYQTVGDALKSGDLTRLGAVLNGMDDDTRGRVLGRYGLRPESATEFTKWYQNAAQYEQVKTQNMQALTDLYGAQKVSQAQSVLDRLVERGVDDPQVYAETLRGFGLDPDKAGQQIAGLAGAATNYRVANELRNKYLGGQVAGQELENEIRSALKGVTIDDAKVRLLANTITAYKDAKLGDANTYANIMTGLGIDKDAAQAAAQRLAAQTTVTAQGDIVEQAVRALGMRQTDVTPELLKQYDWAKGIPDSDLQNIAEQVNTKIQSNRNELLRQSYELVVKQGQAAEAKQLTDDLGKYGMTRDQLDRGMDRALEAVAKGSKPEDAIAAFFPDAPAEFRERAMAAFQPVFSRAKTAWELGVSKDKLDMLNSYMNAAEKAASKEEVDRLAGMAKNVLGPEAGSYIRAYAGTRAFLNDINVDANIVDKMRALRPQDPSQYGQALSQSYQQWVQRFGTAKANALANAVKSVWSLDAANQVLDQQGKRADINYKDAHAAYFAIRGAVDQREFDKNLWEAQERIKLGWAQFNLDKDRFAFEMQQAQEAAKKVTGDPLKVINAAKTMYDVAGEEVVKQMLARGYGKCVGMAQGTNTSSFIGLQAVLSTTDQECSEAVSKVMKDPTVQRLWATGRGLILTGDTGDTGNTGNTGGGGTGGGGGQGGAGGVGGVPKFSAAFNKAPTFTDYQPQVVSQKASQVFGNAVTQESQNAYVGYAALVYPTEQGRVGDGRGGPLQLQSAGLANKDNIQCSKYTDDTSRALCQGGVMVRDRRFTASTIGPLAYPMHLMPIDLKLGDFEQAGGKADTPYAKLTDPKNVQANPKFANDNLRDMLWEGVPADKRPPKVGFDYTPRDVAATATWGFLHDTPVGRSIYNTYLGGMEDPRKMAMIYGLTYLGVKDPKYINADIARDALSKAANTLGIRYEVGDNDIGAFVRFAQNMTLGAIGGALTGRK